MIEGWFRWRARCSVTASQRTFQRTLISDQRQTPLPSTAFGHVAKSAAERRRRVRNPLAGQDCPKVNPPQQSPQKIGEVITYSISRSEVVERLNQQLVPSDSQRLESGDIRDDSHQVARSIEHCDLSLFKNRVSADSIGLSSQDGSNQEALKATDTSREISGDRTNHFELSSQRSCNDLMDRAFLAECKGHDKAAEVLYLESLRLHAMRSNQALLGASSNGTSSNRVRTSKSLAALYFRQQRYQEAEPLLHQTLQLQLQIDAEDELVGEMSYLLAQIYQQQQRYAEADELFQRALSVFGQHLGADHPRTQAVYRDLMQLLINSIETDAFEELNAGSTPLDLDNLCEVYSWAKPIWQQ